MAPRVRAIIAARREAITWRRTRNIDTPQAYWSYLTRYPRGAHSDDARRRLAYLSAAIEPPPSFAVVAYDVPPPPPEEMTYVERPVLVFDDPDFGFAPPPPPPIIFLPPPPVYFVDLPPPPPPLIVFVLPVPVYRPVPVWVILPRRILLPPNNIICNNIHNHVVINNTTNIVTITNPQGRTRTITPARRASRWRATLGVASPPAALKAGTVAAGIGAAGAAALLAPSLPPALVSKAAVTPNPKSAPPAKPLAPGGFSAHPCGDAAVSSVQRAACGRGDSATQQQTGIAAAAAKWHAGADGCPARGGASARAGRRVVDAEAEPEGDRTTVARR